MRPVDDIAPIPGAGPPPRPGPRHHPSGALLAAYVAGSLGESFDLVIAAHVTLCDACRAELMSQEILGGALLETMPPAPLRTPPRAPAGQPEPPTPAATPASDLPAPLGRYVGGSRGDIRWRGVGGGVKQAILPTGGPGRVRLLQIAGGAAMPDHGHRGIELTLVLEGAFRDEDRLFARGDLQEADAALEHTPIALDGPPCICLAVTDAPLRFKSLLPRLAQPFLRI